MLGGSLAHFWILGVVFAKIIDVQKQRMPHHFIDSSDLWDSSEGVFGSNFGRCRVDVGTEIVFSELSRAI